MRGPLVLGLLLLAPLAGCLDAGGDAEPLRHGVEKAPRQHPPWADPDAAVIRPGVPLRTEAGECPTNFVFTRPDNGTIFLGTTAYCVRDLPLGSLATIGDDRHLAVLVYSSWIAMSEIGEQDPHAHEYNDFAVFHVDSSARPDAHPALVGMGGPTGLADPQALALGDRLLAFARDPEAPPLPVNETPLLPLPALDGPGGPAWREAAVTGRAGDWALLVHGAPPALPGGMGGAVLTPDGRAVGVLVNVGVHPNPGANGVARLDKLMAYAAEHANLDMVLATWDLLPAGAGAAQP